MDTRLTRLEIDAILSVAGDAFAYETLMGGFSEEDPEWAEQCALLEAFETGMDKLRLRLARIKLRPPRRTAS